MALVEDPSGTDGHARTNFLVLIAGEVVGGIMFAALDTLVNQNGGYVRKASTTLAHVVAKCRIEIRRQLHAVLKLPPFDALPTDLTELIAGMLAIRSYKQGSNMWSKGEDTSEAFLVIDGEVDIVVDGKQGETAGPAALVGLLSLFIENLASIGTLKAKTDVEGLVLSRSDVDELRSLSSEFDQACHAFASKRVEKL